MPKFLKVLIPTNTILLQYMVTDVIHTYCGDHFTIHTNIKVYVLHLQLTQWALLQFNKNKHRAKLH